MLKHEPVLLNEVIKALNIKKDQTYLDLTIGGAGHSAAILKALNHTGFLYAFDQDEFAINIAKKNLINFSNYQIFHANFKDVKTVLEKQNVFQVNGIILDLGMSSFQIDDSSRGFSYMREGPLDMRMDTNSALTAATVLNTYSHSQLTKIFKTYGQEPNSYQIAKKIIAARPLKTTFDLVKITDFFPSKGHSAKKVFQALRIYINQELTYLTETLPVLASLLKKDGVLAIITFHSLEDRIVKHYFKSLCEETIIKGVPTLPKKMPFRYYFKKAIKPSENEIKQNPRAQSAILRVIIKN